MRKIKKKLYIDALVLVPEMKSGVGVTLQNTLDCLVKLKEQSGWEIFLVVPLGKAKYLKGYESKSVHIRTIYLPAKALAFLSRAKLLPPIDWFLGSGVYLFPNYKNWPTWHSRSITYVYDVAYIKYPETVQIKNQKYLYKNMPNWIRRTDRAVTISQQVKFEIEKYLNLGEGRIAVVPCGVDQTIFYKREAKEIETVKAHYRIPFSKYFLYVGNIEPRKNLIKLLDAYNNLSSSIQEEYGLVFVGGDGWQNEAFYKKLKELQQANKKVMKVTDYVVSADLPAIYSGATMLVHPAIYEGFGITPLEALACGTAVAVADLPAIRETVQDAGSYFDPHITKSIVDAINTVLNQKDLVATNLKLGLELASEFSWNRSAGELFKVISYEQTQGAHKHPVLARLLNMYKMFDRNLLQLLGEKPLPPYKPPTSKDAEQLRENIYVDFINEQPTRGQIFFKKIYLGTKHRVFVVLRSVYHALTKARV